MKLSYNILASITSGGYMWGQDNNTEQVNISFIATKRSWGNSVVYLTLSEEKAGKENVVHFHSEGGRIYHARD